MQASMSRSLVAASHNRRAQPCPPGRPQQSPVRASLLTMKSLSSSARSVQMQQLHTSSTAIKRKHTMLLSPSRYSGSNFPSRRSSVRVAAGWGAPIEYKPAKVVSNDHVAAGQYKLVIDVGSHIAAGYTKPGQYVMLKRGEEAKPGFFAIASTPRGPEAASGQLELLIKRPAGGAKNVAELLVGLSSGDSLEVSPVQGKGFPVDRIPSEEFQTVLLFATGTGISPIKALIESGMLGKRSDVRLFYGTRNADSTAYSHLVDGWRALGVTVNHVYSDEKRGYIQDAFASATDGSGKLANPAATGVILCGHGDMCKAVTALLTSKGVAADKVLMNY